ncbi:MAG: helix-turn-helix domain-containing protein [Ktedonobacterales bacterium]
MATDGTPEPAAKRCGEAIARLRTARRWSRAQFLIRLFDELSPDDPNYDSISETWLARLENGRMVKVPRQTIEALCRALRCTPQERAWVLLHADRSLFTDHEHEPTPAGELLTYVMDQLYSEAREVLNGLVGQRPASELDEAELLDVTAAALDVLRARRQQRQAIGAVTAAEHVTHARPASHPVHTHAAHAVHSSYPAAHNGQSSSVYRDGQRERVSLTQPHAAHGGRVALSTVPASKAAAASR